MVTLKRFIQHLKNDEHDRRLFKITMQLGGYIVAYMMLFFVLTQVAFGYYTSEKYDGFDRPDGTNIGGNLTESGADNFGLIDSTMYINGAGNGKVQDLLMNQSIAYTLNDSLSFQFKIDLESAGEFLTQFIYGGGIKRGGHYVTMEYGATGNTVEVTVPNGAYVIGNYVIGQWHTLNYTWLWNGSTEIFFDGVSGGIFTGLTSESSGIYQYDCLTAPCDINLDNFTIWTNHSTPTNTPPEITLLYPVNESWTNDKINGTCEDTDGVLTVKVNDSRFVRNTTFNFTDWTFDYVGTASDYINISVNCTDNLSLTTTNLFQLGIDIIPPSCSTLTNASIPSGTSYNWNVNCIDDYNLYSLNITCLNTTGSTYSFYQNNLNTTSYNFLNNSGVQNQSFSCNWTSQDAHTDNFIKDKLNEKTIKANGSKIVINGFEYIETQQNVNELTLDYTGNSKIGFTYDMPIKNKDIPETKTFYVNAKKEMYYYQDEKYKAWFVIDNEYWVDFNLKNDKKAIYTVTRISDRRYKVDVWTSKQKLIFNSIGIINTNLQYQDITVNAYVAPVNVTAAEGTHVYFGTEAQTIFLLSLLLFILIVLICFFAKDTGMLNIIAFVYGLALTFYAAKNNVLPNIIVLMPALIGLGTILNAWRKTKN